MSSLYHQTHQQNKVATSQNIPPFATNMWVSFRGCIAVLTGWVDHNQIALSSPVLAIMDNAVYYCNCPEQKYQPDGVPGAGCSIICEVTIIPCGKTCNSFSCREPYLPKDCLKEDVTVPAEVLSLICWQWQQSSIHSTILLLSQPKLSAGGIDDSGQTSIGATYQSCQTPATDSSPDCESRSQASAEKHWSCQKVIPGRLCNQMLLQSPTPPLAELVFGYFPDKYS